MTRSPKINISTTIMLTVTVCVLAIAALVTAEEPVSSQNILIKMLSCLLHRFHQTVSCYLSGAPCQMPHQTSVNPNQTSVRQVPPLHQTYTIHLTDIYVWWAYGTCLMYMWYLSDRCLVGNLTIVWCSSDREHQTNSNRLGETVV